MKERRQARTTLASLKDLQEANVNVLWGELGLEVAEGRSQAYA